MNDNISMHIILEYEFKRKLTVLLTDMTNKFDHFDRNFEQFIKKLTRYCISLTDPSQSDKSQVNTKVSTRQIHESNS